MGKPKKCEDPAAILAIGTANPPNCIEQANYPDFLFGVRNTKHLKDVKKKFEDICKKSAIEKRYFHLNKDILEQYPALRSSGAPSTDPRQDLTMDAILKLGKEAAMEAIKQWGQHKSAITDLIFCSWSGVDMSSAGEQLRKDLGLQSSVRRVTLYDRSCYAGKTVLEMAKDTAEENPRARVLVVCAESTIISFRAPSEDDPMYLASNALFGDGAAAVIIGTVSPLATKEQPIFQIISAASQSEVPDPNKASQSGPDPSLDETTEGHRRELGLIMQISDNVLTSIAANPEKIPGLVEASGSNMFAVWNSIFWAPHPGRMESLERMEKIFKLGKGRLSAARDVLKDHGNMLSAHVLFILDEMRNKSIQKRRATTGEGMELGVLLGFGPGLTVETVILRSVPITPPAK